MSTLANRISEIQKEGMEKFQTCTHVICSRQLLHFYQKIAIEVKNIEDNLEILCFGQQMETPYQNSSPMPGIEPQMIELKREG